MRRLTLIITDDCNGRCDYCFQMRKQDYMSFDIAKKAIDLVFKPGDTSPEIYFYGGEPFLAFDLIQQVVSFCEKRFSGSPDRPAYFVTSNGTLIDRTMLDYCVTSNIQIALSIDGNRQAHATGRGEESFTRVMETIRLYDAHPDYPLQTVSVITPHNVECLSASVEFLFRQQVDTLTLTFQYESEWNQGELELLQQEYRKAFYFLMRKKSEGYNIEFNELKPVSIYKPVFKCTPGHDGVICTPGGDMYGCVAHVPWSRIAWRNNTLHRYEALCLGHIDRLSLAVLNKRKEEIYENQWLCNQYLRHTPETACRDCAYVFRCGVCPVISMAESDDQCLVNSWVCAINRMLYDLSDEFWSVSVDIALKKHHSALQ
ncbi:radical SAM protein [bacterium]|nr:radical SAM protein [bacterium]